eukprot:9211297-Karenia_brevis.AAC.1
MEERRLWPPRSSPRSKSCTVFEGMAQALLSTFKKTDPVAISGSDLLLFDTAWKSGHGTASCLGIHSLSSAEGSNGVGNFN